MYAKWWLPCLLTLLYHWRFNEEPSVVSFSPYSVLHQCMTWLNQTRGVKFCLSCISLSQTSIVVCAAEVSSEIDPPGYIVEVVEHCSVGWWVTGISRFTNTNMAPHRSSSSVFAFDEIDSSVSELACVVRLLRQMSENFGTLSRESVLRYRNDWSRR